MRSKAVIAMAVLLATVLSCNLPRATPTPSATAELAQATDAPAQPPTEPSLAPPTEVTAPVVQASKPVFATYPKIQVRLPTAYSGYELPVDPATIGNLRSFLFSTGQGDLLSDNGFVVVPGHWREFYELYENARYDETPVFVTTDSVYHVYHLLFDKMLV